MSELTEVQTAMGQGKKLLYIVEDWLRKERDQRHIRAAERAADTTSQPAPKPKAPYMPSKHMAFFR